MRILSIDYDYFQTAGAETFKECYPDGIDRNTEESKKVWADILSDKKNQKRISNVRLNRSEMNCAEKIILSQRRDIPVMAVCSHKDMYDFAHRLAKPSESLEVVNVDMHHDMFNDNPQVDCGNWVSSLMNEYEHFKFRWVANPTGLDVYGFEDGETRNLISTSLESLIGEQFDALFLCRSDNWVAPHLDYGFQRLLDTCQTHFHFVKTQDCILYSRILFIDSEREERQDEEYLK